jgi:hypothetical protein
MMERSEMKAQFLAYNDADRNMLLLGLMHNLTLVIRDVFHERAEGAKVKASAGVSEINHKITSFVIAKMSNQAHYPDDLIIDFIVDGFIDADISGYLQQAWDTSVRTLAARRARAAALAEIPENGKLR